MDKIYKGYTKQYMEKDNAKSAALFGNNPDISLDERVRMVRELEKIGSLTFKITTNEEGWVAQCQEVSGIIAGGTNPNPTSTEIESQIRDSIYAAFNVKITETKGSPYFSYGDFNQQGVHSHLTTKK